MSATDPTVDPNAPPATPPTSTTPTDQLPQWVQDLMDEYGFKLDPQQAMAFANATANMGLQMAMGQMDYQADFLKQKQKELNLSQKQMKLMEKQFEFQSGEYWDWFSGELFDYQKQQAENSFTLDKLNLRTQRGLSKEELARSKNATLSTMYTTEAAKAQAEAEKWSAMAKMGAPEQQEALQTGARDLLWGTAGR